MFFEAHTKEKTCKKNLGCLIYPSKNNTQKNKPCKKACFLAFAHTL
jgi:hypothetical protein